MAHRLYVLLPELLSRSSAPVVGCAVAVRLQHMPIRAMCTRASQVLGCMSVHHQTCQPAHITGGAAFRRTAHLASRGAMAGPDRGLASATRSDDRLASLVTELEEGAEVNVQGVQGDDCVTFETWLASCRRFGLANCDQQLQGIQSGRKTLAQVLAEQEQLIAEIAEDYQRRAREAAARHPGEGGPDPQGLQGAGLFSLPELSTPCPQGIQGEDCAKFRIWLENCHRFGFGNCLEQLQGLQGGRKSLAQIFAEQEALIKEVVQQHQQKRSFSTQARGVGGQGQAGQVGGHAQGPVAGLPQGSKVVSTLQLDQARGTLGSFGSRGYSSSPSSSPPPQPDSQTAAAPGAEAEKNLSQKDRLKRAVKEYGATVIVFHVAISLASLGGFYLAVSSGLDVVGLLQRLGVGESILQSRLAAGTSTFVVAYAVHKVFAPARIAITLTCTPLIVRYLRRIGFLKVKNIQPPAKP